MRDVDNLTPLREVVELIMGQAPPSKDTNFESQGIPVKVGEFGLLRPVIREWTTNPLRKARTSDVLLCVVGATCGKINLGEDCAIGRSVAAIRPNSTKLDQFYLYYFMMTLVDRLRSGSVGAAQTVISKEMVESVNIPLPLLPEQQRIVALLDEAFAGLATAKANAERNLQNARAIFESHLQSVFSQRGEGWEEKKVSDIAKHSLGKMLDKAKNRGELQPYLRNINVRWLTFDLSDLLEMPFLPTEAEKFTAVKGDVLICEGGYPGRAAIWNEDFPIYFQKALHRVRFHEPEINKWFVYFLILQDSSGQLMQYFSGTGIQHFTGEALARFKIPVPPLAEMRKCVARFEALSVETQHLTRLYERKLAALEELKKSLLHQAFNGEL